MIILKNILHPIEQGRNILLDIFASRTGKKKAVVLFTHGYKSFKDWGCFNLLGEFFAEKSLIFIKYNLSCNGTTPESPDRIEDKEAFGRNTVSIELSDIREMINRIAYMSEIEDNEIDRDNIFLMGHSRGGSDCIIAAKEQDRVKKLITLSAFNDYEKTWASFYDIHKWQEDKVIYRPDKLTGELLPLYFSLYEDYQQNRDRFNLKNAVKCLKIPFMVFHGIEDQFIYYQEAIEMKRWNKRIYLNLMPYTNHNFGCRHPYYKNYLPEDWQLIAEESVKFFTP